MHNSPCAKLGLITEYLYTVHSLISYLIIECSEILFKALHYAPFYYSNSNLFKQQLNVSYILWSDITCSAQIIPTCF